MNLFSPAAKIVRQYKQNRMTIKSDTDGGPDLVTEWDFSSSDAINLASHAVQDFKREAPWQRCAVLHRYGRRAARSEVGIDCTGAIHF
jgi:hypothetical protein